MKDTLDTKFDQRTRDRALRDGSLTKEDLQKHLKTLPDESGQTEEVPVFEEPQKGDEPTFSAVG